VPGRDSNPTSRTSQLKYWIWHCMGRNFWGPLKSRATVQLKGEVAAR